MPAKERVVFLEATRNYFGAPRWLAEDFGLFHGAGIDAVTLPVVGTETGGKGVLAGQGHISTVATEQLFNSRDDGADLIGVCGSVNRSPFSLITRPGIVSIEQLRGKVVGVSSLNSGTSALLANLLYRYGLAAADYRLVAVGPIETRWAMLQSGEIDAGLQGVPLDMVAVDRGFNNLGMLGDLWPELQFAVYVVEGGWARANRPALVGYLIGLIAGFELFYVDRAKAAESVLRHSGLSANYADRAWQAYVDAQIFPHRGELNVAGLQALLEVSASARGQSQRARVDPLHYFDLSYWEEAGARSASA